MLALKAQTSSVISLGLLSQAGQALFFAPQVNATCDMCDPEGTKN